MLRDVPESKLVRRVGGERTPDHAVLIDDREEIIVRGGLGGSGLGALLVMTGRDASYAAGPMDTVLTHGDAVFVGQFIGEESVSEGRIILVSLVEDADEVSVVPVPLRDRSLYAAARRRTSFSCSSKRIRLFASRSCLRSSSLSPGRWPSSISAFFIQLNRDASETPKSFATYDSGARPLRATATTSSRNSLG